MYSVKQLWWVEMIYILKHEERSGKKKEDDMSMQQKAGAWKEG